MASRLSFVKMSGAGNDFVLLEAQGPRRPWPALARRLCDRREGIGADGLLVLQKSKGRAKVLYFNADGSAAFCGNGARCASWRLHQLGAPKAFEFEADGSVIKARVTGPERIAIAMPRPHSFKMGLHLKAADKDLLVHYLNTGVPHAVVEVKGLEGYPVFAVGRALRRHKAFAPAGANANFISAKRGVLAIRTYERGVEDETLACGTGATAAALAASLLGRVKSPTRVLARGGDLRISFKKTVDGFDDVWLEGPARVVYAGEIKA